MSPVASQDKHVYRRKKLECRVLDNLIAAMKHEMGVSLNQNNSSFCCTLQNGGRHHAKKLGDFLEKIKTSQSLKSKNYDFNMGFQRRGKSSIKLNVRIHCENDATMVEITCSKSAVAQKAIQIIETELGLKAKSVFFCKISRFRSLFGDSLRPKIVSLLVVATIVVFLLVIGVVDSEQAWKMVLSVF